MSSVDLAVDVHDAPEEMMVVERSPALHVAIMYVSCHPLVEPSLTICFILGRFFIDSQGPKNRIWTSISPRPARESLAERCDSPTS